MKTQGVTNIVTNHRAWGGPYISMSLLSRLILKEIAFPFLFSFCALSALLLLGRMLPLLTTLLRVGITLPEFFKLLVLMMPNFWMIVIPMATLLGILIGFLRLTRDSETLALFACGVRPSQLLKPAVAISGICWILSLLVAALVVPMSKSSSRSMLRDLTQRTLTRGFPEEKFITPVSGLTLYVHQSTSGGHQFKGVFIRDARKPEMANQIFAQSGELLTDLKGSRIALRLQNGILNRINQDYTRTDIFEFRSYTLQLSLPSAQADKKRGEMGLGSLWKNGNDPKNSREERNRYMTEFHKRISIPTGTLILGILAVPLGILFGRTGLSSGVALGLSAFLAYYLMVAFMANLAEASVFPASVGLWLPNLILAGLTGTLLRRLVREAA